MMKYIFLALLLMTACRAVKSEYNPKTVYLIIQSPNYDLFLSKNDMLNCLEQNRVKKRVFSDEETSYYDAIKRISKTDSIKTDTDYHLVKSNYLEKMDLADAFYSCAIDLFKKHKVLIYNKVEKQWISRYRVRRRVYIDGVENPIYYEVLYDDKLIYDYRN